MNSAPGHPSTPTFKRIALVILVVTIGLSLVTLKPSRLLPSQSKQSATVRNSPVQVISTNVTTVSARISGVLPNSPSFQKRPFPVAYESPRNQWTLADGRDTNMIRQLAHNQLEYDRMVEENSRIFRRQLVYLKETAAAVLEQAKLGGRPVQQLTLPGVDGQELQFEITKSDSNGSSRRGMFSGHLAGNPDSLVTMAFMDGREAFTVLSPKDNIFVVGEPREDAQVIVKAIDPNTYGVAPEMAGDILKK